MFKYKPGIKVGYARQGYIYFVSLMYSELAPDKRQCIDRLCREHGGEYWRALRDFVTTESSATKICERHHLSRSTLYRVVKRYYEEFPRSIA